MNYKIITNEKNLRDFIDFLPELSLNEIYYVTLLARNKYCGDVKLNKTQIKRFVSKKEHLFDDIKELEVELGAYKSKGEPIPQEALALYITPNPRCLKTATKLLVKELIDDLCSENNKFRPQNKLLSVVQRAKSKNRFVMFDFDYPNDLNIDELISKSISDISLILNKDAFRIIRTRGGIQLVVIIDKIDSIHKKDFYMKIKQFNYIDLGYDSSNSIIPVVGGYQGGFSPHFIY